MRGTSGEPQGWIHVAKMRRFESEQIFRRLGMKRVSLAVLTATFLAGTAALAIAQSRSTIGTGGTWAGGGMSSSSVGTGGSAAGSGSGSGSASTVGTGGSSAGGGKSGSTVGAAGSSASPTGMEHGKGHDRDRGKGHE